MNKITGVTLIELIISIILSLFMTISIAGLYLTIHKTLLAQTALMNIHENMQIILQRFHSSIAAAGFIGCAKLTNQFPVASYPPINISQDNMISAYKDSEMKAGTDAITIMSASAAYAKLTESMEDLAELHVSDEPHFVKENVLLISDCLSADIFTIKKITKIKKQQIIQTVQPLSKKYPEDAEVRLFEVNKYFVAKTSRYDSNGLPIYALYLKDIYSRKTELIEGVDDMKIQYTYSQMSDKNQIRGVNLSFVLGSLNNFKLKKKIYSYVALRS